MDKNQNQNSDICYKVYYIHILQSLIYIENYIGNNELMLRFEKVLVDDIKIGFKKELSNMGL